MTGIFSHCTIILTLITVTLLSASLVFRHEVYVTVSMLRIRRYEIRQIGNIQSIRRQNRTELKILALREWGEDYIPDRPFTRVLQKSN